MPVVIVEGEKAADAAKQLLLRHVCISSPGGSNAAKKADWSVLQGREIVIWPDADEAGLKFC
ncbi:toprim domain-containing protein [Pseudovibrio sp. POLY-S9]|uniref:toprim domain-containing protein n=1 Tax=Pseudovibrio sp. POLY-S9 TaxID=1576596 RepID=UPI000B17C48A|nr:toprim domain-containing protein [Pseudovibrio sp. POLY-S9]